MILLSTFAVVSENILSYIAKCLSLSRRRYVPEVLNVHVNENNLKNLFF